MNMNRLGSQIKIAATLGTLIASMGSVTSANASTLTLGYSTCGVLSTTCSITQLATDTSTSASGPAAGISPQTLDNFSILTFAATGNFNNTTFQSSNINTSFSGTSTGTIYLFASLSGINSIYSPTLGIASILNNNDIPTGWSMTEKTWYNTDNSTWGTGTNVASYVFGSSTGSKNFLASVAAPTSPFSVLEMFEITANPGTGNTNATISMKAVPEPSDLGMMGLGLMMIGLMGLKVRQRNNRSKSLDA